MGEGEMYHALADLDRAATGRPGSLKSVVLFNRGRCYWAKGDDDRAIAELTESLPDFSDRSRVYWYQARCFWNQHDLDHALADYDQPVRLRPNVPEVYIDRANLLWEKGDEARALGDLDQLVRVCPENSTCYFLRAVMTTLIQREWNLALADMDRAVALEPRAAYNYAFRGFLKAREGKVIPTCRDLALCILTLDQLESQPVLVIDWQRRRVRVGIGLRVKETTKQTQPPQYASDIDTKCLDLGVQRLVSAAFGSSR
jgi:tetratricopeptide (TPR) repeat protein